MPSPKSNKYLVQLLLLPRRLTCAPPRRFIVVLLLVFVVISAAELPLLASAKLEQRQPYGSQFQNTRVPLYYNQRHKRGVGGGGERQTVYDSASESGVSAPLRLSPTYPQRSPFKTNPAFVGVLVGIASIFIAGLMA